MALITHFDGQEFSEFVWRSARRISAGYVCSLLIEEADTNPALYEARLIIEILGYDMTTVLEGLSYGRSDGTKAVYEAAIAYRIKNG